MGMTIDEAIERLSTSAMIIGPEDWGEARDILISTARKYQKIRQIIEADKYQPANTYVCGGVWLTDEKRVSAIREVLEDGNGVPEVRI